MISVGIEQIRFATGSYVLDLEDLANDLQADPEKYRVGLGQLKMSVCAQDEDIVTMAAAAAAPMLQDIPKDTIRTLLMATETGIDQSKAAGVYVHKLLGLHPHCRIIEIKQACYGAVAALQLGASYVQAHPDERVLVIASDIARYDPKSSAEPTQGCGAAAFVISCHPKILHIDSPCGIYSEDVMDFWRPNYRQNALVDGKFSAKVYFQALRHCWQDLKERFGLSFKDFDRYCYHLPFTRLAQKAHTQMVQECDPGSSLAQHLNFLDPSLYYSRLVGNCYTASVFLGIISLLEKAIEDLTNKRLAVFSYGSGLVSELFCLRVAEGYKTYLHPQAHENQLNERKRINIERYRFLQSCETPQDGRLVLFPKETSHAYRLKGIEDHKRLYEAVL
jgi:hydroxymethylglutaryl-CoA synthase